MKVAVIGGGAIGLLTSYYFCKLGFDTTVVTRTESQKQAILNKGITLKLNDSVGNESVNASVFHEEVYKDCQLWIVTMKQYSLQQFFDRWKGVEGLPEILFLQNGLGHLEKAAQFLQTVILAGSVTHGAMRVSETEVIHTGQGKVVLGEWLGHSETLDKLPILEPQFPIEVSTDMTYILERKLLVNAVINPLTALYKVRNGVLLENKFFQAVTKNVFHEAVGVLQLSESEWKNVQEVIQLTAKNESSMFRDLKNGHRTEIDAITGYLLDLAEQKTLDIPLIKFLHHSIAGLERSAD